MPFQFTVSPDFGAKALPSWFMFNTWLQRILGENIHFEVFDEFPSQRAAIAAGKIDLIYANPYDASALIRALGFSAVAAPHGRFDEAVIAVRADSPVERVEELQPGLRIATTDDPDVDRMCMILLEPADLEHANVQPVPCESYVLVAKALMQGRADVGFFLEATFGELSNLVRSVLRPLIRSRISTIRHVLLVGPRLAPRLNDLQRGLKEMSTTERGKGVLAALGFESWERLEQEDVEFMIDLMDTLVERRP